MIERVRENNTRTRGAEERHHEGDHHPEGDRKGTPLLSTCISLIVRLFVDERGRTLLIMKRGIKLGAAIRPAKSRDN